ncbi:MAG: AAA family ATPase, partial [Candidatus Eremiobacteraeota bacterium]|nr:AAA family ATPase [Candidatus Eremiobacteraeota bacterium]
MRLIELRVDGFGKLVGRRIVFDPGFTIVYGPNEAGKSTLETAIVATLFGVGRKDDREAWRPWTSQRYATVLRYALEDGRTFEVQRDFDRDPKSVRVYDENGNDVSAELSVGKVVNPGHAHLRIPLEVFLNASCVEQGKAQIDGARAERISSMLAHALDGGPREDAALGAIARLDEALKTHVGTPRATVRAPLRRLTEELDEHRTRADEIRAALRRLDDLRSRLEAEEQRSGDLAAALGEHDRLGRSLRAHVVRSRLESLRDVRDDVAALDAERANYDDVDDIVPGRIGDLDGRFADWRAAEAHASSAAEAAAEARLTPTLEAELAERLRDGGAVDDDGFAALQRAVDEASDARAKATNAAARMQTARRSIEGGNELFGALMAGSAVILMLAVVLAIVHAWAWALPVTALAATGLGAATHRWNHRKRTVAAIDALERGVDAAVIAERDANTRVAAVLEPLGVSSIEELARRRERARELLEARSVARRAADRAGAARSAAQAAGRHFDELAKTYIVASGSREADMESARKRDARRSARDGIDLRLSMYEVRRRDVVADDDEFALESELADLLAAGVAPAPIAGSQRAFEAERASLERRCAES